MNVIEVTHGKKRFLELLLMADEQESMVDRYLDRGRMFAEESGKAECVVTEEGDFAEIKNLAVLPEYRGQGFGRKMIEFVEKLYRGKYSRLRVGTGDSPLTVPFYEKCGFSEISRIKDFFTENYDHPIYEAGVLLRDMVVLEKVI